jgi:VCBS repeat-containing protein
MWTYSLFNNIDGDIELNSGDIVHDSFTFTSFDGTPQIITITINGADREVISDPEITEVKEDEGDTDLGTIDLEGKLTINVGATQLVDPFKEEVTFSPDNIGSINFAADGSYKYSINNNNIQFLGEEKPHYDFFNVFSKNGSIKTLVFKVIGVNDMPVVKEIGQDENKYAGSANVEELINLDHFTSDPAINTDTYYKAKYDFDHIRTGQFLVSDVDVGDQLTVSNESTNPDEKIGNLSTVILQLKDSEGNPIGGKYVVNWTYTVKDSELDPLNKGVDENPTKDQKFTVTINDGNESVNTEVVLHLFGRDEIEFSEEKDNLYLGDDGETQINPSLGYEVLYLGKGDDSAYLQSFYGPINSLVYGEDGSDQISLIEKSSVAFGGLDRDIIGISSEIEEAIVFGDEGADIITLEGNPENLYTANGREAYIWGGAGRDTILQSSLSLLSSSTPINDWLMDFDTRKPSDGGDRIKYFDFTGSDLTSHTFSKSETALEERYADSNHPFMSEGEKYYSLQAISKTDEKWYSVLNLVGIDGTEITLDGLFANGNFF